MLKKTPKGTPKGSGDSLEPQKTVWALGISQKGTKTSGGPRRSPKGTGTSANPKCEQGSGGGRTLREPQKAGGASGSPRTELSGSSRVMKHPG